MKISLAEFVGEVGQAKAADAIGVHQTAISKAIRVLVPIEPTYQMCEAMGLQWESPRFPDRYKAMLAAVKK